jgi:hypothetical protein
VKLRHTSIHSRPGVALVVFPRISLADDPHFAAVGLVFLAAVRQSLALPG